MQIWSNDTLIHYSMKQGVNKCMIALICYYIGLALGVLIGSLKIRK